MNDRPPPRGRGAVLLAALKKRKQEEELHIGEQQTSIDEPKKIMGRAALLKHLQEAKLKKVGVLQSGTQSELLTPALIEKELEDVAIPMSELSITEREVVSYRGESGKLIKTSVNYIKLYTDKEKGVYEYEVRFQPELDAKNRRIRAVNMIMREMGSTKLFDGGSVLYLPQQITQTSKTYKIHIPGADGDQEIAVTLIFKRKKNFAERECLHLYNVLFKRIMHILLYTQMGRSYFNGEHKTLIPQHKLEIYPGFAVSVDEQEDGLMVCLDTQHRVLRTQNVYELLTELKCTAGDRFKEAAFSNIIGSTIFTRYNNRTYVVDDIAWDMNPQDTFPTRDGGSITFTEYYKNQYDITIRDVNQPLLINRKTVQISGQSEKTERMICLVPELSYLTGLSDAMRADFKVMKDVAQYVRVTPHQRLAALREYLRKIRNSEAAQGVFAEWGLKIDKDALELKARQLEPETIYFGGDVVVQSSKADWNRATAENKVTGPVDMLNWILFYTEKDSKYAKDFAQMMCRMGGVLGCRINQPNAVRLRDDRNETYVQACRDYINKNVQIVVFICPTMRSDRYSVIKKVCCTQIPIPSQVINSRTLSNPSKVRSIVQKIALQMTCKLGGTLWTVRFPFKSWMIIGIDVYHGSPGTQSVCGFVASLNESMSRWYSIAVFQEKELGDHLKIAFYKALEAYKNENGCFPSKIVVIRDGVGDGQLDHCKRYEVSQMQSVLKQFGLETKLCFIIVQKRINTRIFSCSKEGPENPPPGTVLDHGVTRSHLHDFFLVPQNVRQGTVNPTHYIVLHDECALKPDQTQRLCYKLCHLYYNWPGTIRVPAPCQYAHKLAGLIGQNIKKAPSAVLADTLFYL